MNAIHWPHRLPRVSGRDRVRFRPWRILRLVWLKADRRVWHVRTETWLTTIAIVVGVLFVYMLINDPYFHAGK